MKEEKNLETGNVKISEDVIASIVTIAANEIEGVTVTPTSALDPADRKGKKSTGVRVTRQDGNVSVDVCVKMAYGVKIPQAALKLQQKIKMAVESMTGLSLHNIGVVVAGVTMDKEKRGE